MTVLHADARTADYDARFDGLRRHDEIGAAAKGRSKAATAAYVEGMIAVFTNARRQLKHHARAIIVVEDSSRLYEQILREAGFQIEGRRRRQVSRRTGRSDTEFFEDIILARAA